MPNETKPLSERLQAIADHLRKAFPETSRQADHLDMLVPELAALEAQLAAMREAERQNEWMRRVLVHIGPLTYMRWVEGPQCATGDIDELAFFRELKRKAAGGT